MNRSEIENPIINVVRRKKPGMLRRVVGITASLGIAAEYLLSGGAVFESNNKRPRSNDSSPPNSIVYNNPHFSIDKYLLQMSDPKSTPTLTPTQTPSPTEVPEPTVNYQEAENVVLKMEKRPDLFSKDFIKGIKIYYPIYEAVGSKYDIPPLLLAIIAEDETNQGENLNGYNGRSAPFYGFGQRDTRVWTSADVDKASSGLEYLSNYPQKHPDDWREAAFMGWFLYNHRQEYMQKYKKRGIKQTEALIMALGRYNNPASGNERYYQYLIDQKALGNS